MGFMVTNCILLLFEHQQFASTNDNFEDSNCCPLIKKTVHKIMQYENLSWLYCVDRKICPEGHLYSDSIRWIV